ncbi:glycosyltransferase [Litorilinea aerophila]|nr:glycosyltransferase [Litorilinea aerophila]MCC9078412.1 glycosyltransferase [Litorilinea aerophila]
MTIPISIPVRRVAMLSVHTCPLAMLGGKKTGGMNVYVRDFARELGCQGIQVDVFTRSQDDCQPMINHDLGPNARVIHIPAGPEKPIPVAEIAQYLDEFAEGVWHFAQVEGRHYDLIHSHYWMSGLVAEALQRQWGDLPLVHMFHTLGHMKNQIARDESERAPQDRLDGEHHVVAIADRIIAATPAEETQLIELYDADPAKITVIPPGVDLARFHPLDKAMAKKKVGIPCGDTNILFAGRIEPLKGVDTLLRAMSILQERHPEAVRNACVAIIGGDPWADDLDAEMARLQALRAELGIHDLVTFLGAKDQDVLPYYYAAAEMVVMPSHYESFGMVALEAMAMGTPVIASEVGGLAYLVQHGLNGFHVPSRDPEALAARILELLTDRELRERLGQQARIYAQQFSWDRIVQRMLDVYAAVMAQRGAPPMPPAPAVDPCRA